jgi:hypothetical protein
MYELFEGQQFELRKVSPKVLKFFKQDLEIDFVDNKKLSDFSFNITIGSGDDKNQEILVKVINALFKRADGKEVTKEEIETLELDLAVFTKGFQDFFFRLASPMGNFLS